MLPLETRIFKKIKSNKNIEISFKILSLASLKIFYGISLRNSSLVFFAFRLTLRSLLSIKLCFLLAFQSRVVSSVISLKNRLFAVGVFEVPSDFNFLSPGFHSCCEYGREKAHQQGYHEEYCFNRSETMQANHRP